MVKIKSALLAAILALAVDTDAPIDGAKVGLYTGTPDIEDPELALGDLSQPTFGGYSVATPTAWVVGTTDTGAQCARPDEPVVYTATNAVGFPLSVNGAFITDDANLLIAVCPFDEPVSMLEIGQQIVAIPIIPLTLSQEESANAMTL